MTKFRSRTRISERTVPWKHQHFSGTWVSNENCKTDHLKNSLLEKCFNHGKSGIMVIGDSVARALLKALELYIKNETCCFYDENHSMKLHFTVANITRGNFKYVTNFRTQISLIKQNMLVDNNKLILFGPSVLHLIGQLAYAIGYIYMVGVTKGRFGESDERKTSELILSNKFIRKTMMPTDHRKR